MEIELDVELIKKHVRRLAEVMSEFGEIGKVFEESDNILLSIPPKLSIVEQHKIVSTHNKRLGHYASIAIGIAEEVKLLVNIITIEAAELIDFYKETNNPKGVEWVIDVYNEAVDVGSQVNEINKTLQPWLPE
jgi:hypothetical protein